MKMTYKQYLHQGVSFKALMANIEPLKEAKGRKIINAAEATHLKFGDFVLWPEQLERANNG